MNQRRKEIMHELGLMPIWRKKQERISVSIDTNMRSTADIDVLNSHRLDRTRKILNLDWPQLKAEVESCHACSLSQTRLRTVFGIGDEQAHWLFIGEGPGAREDELGEPFVGQAGKLLDSMLAAIQLKRGHDVYITNIVKCRPPNNRNPEFNEAEQCRPYLERQITLIKPKLIIALGKVAAQNLLTTNDSITNLRGRLHSYLGTPLIVTYHPAYLLRSLMDKSKAWEDLCFAKATMESLTVSSVLSID